MARLSVSIKIRVDRELVVRESDGRTLFLYAWYLGQTTPVGTAVFDPEADADPESA